MNHSTEQGGGGVRSLYLWIAPLLTRKMLICVFTGFSSGLPLFLLLQLVPAWMKTGGVDIKTLGFMTLVGLPFSWKFLWAPLLDSYKPPLGRRRGWMLVAQVMLFLLIGALGHFNPVDDMVMVVSLLVLLAFCAATQDVVIDAYRREILSDSDLGLGNAVHVNAYRVAGLVPGSLSLILADHFSWNFVFWITALFMLPGMLMALSVAEPVVKGAPKSLKEACVEPFLEFIRRQGWKGALLVLSFMFLYKLGDSLATALLTPFYLEMAFSKTDIGLIAKNAGLWSAVVGAIMGGLIMKQIGINRALWIFGILQTLAIFGFVWLSWIGPFQKDAITTGNLLALGVVVSAEYLGVGLGTVAFVAFIARTTNPAYAATQFALFTSLATLPRTLVNASAGVLVDWLGWTQFYLFCIVLTLPGLLLLFKVAPWGQGSEVRTQESEDMDQPA